VDEAIEKNLARRAQARAEILEVRVVGDLLDAGDHAPALREAGLVLQVQAAARNARLVVVRKEAPLELAFGSRQQIADLGVELQAAAAHVARLERRVEVRRDVQVVRDRDVEAGAVALGEVRREETALASIVDREREVRGVEN